MANNLSDYAEGQFLAHVFRTATWSKPSALALALGTAGSDSSFTELANSGSYARVAVNPSDSNWAAPSGGNGVTSNANDLSFPRATADWASGSPVTHIAVYDSATYGAGNLIAQTTLTSSRIVQNGVRLDFAAGDVVFTIS